MNQYKDLEAYEKKKSGEDEENERDWRKWRKREYGENGEGEEECKPPSFPMAHHQEMWKE